MSVQLSRLTPGIQAALEVEARKGRYLQDPVLWVEEFLGLHVWSKQREILYSIRDNRNTAVAAGHGLGKSQVASFAMAWWVDVHPPSETFVASTAPFADQISAILWNNLKKIHQLAKDRHEEYKRRLAAGEPLGEFAAADHQLYGYITGDNKWKSPMGVLIGQGRKPPDNKADSGYQGLHARFLLAIGDEAAGLNQDMINALGNIATGEENRQLLICNPTDPTSAMAKIWKDNRPSWTTMNISVYDSPLVTKEPGWERFAAVGMSGQDYIDQMRETWGEEHPEFVIRVKGEWAFERGNNVFSDVAIARSGNALVQPSEDVRPYRQMGVDVARGNTDATELYVCERGTVWETDPETNQPTRDTGRVGYKIRRLNSWTGKPLTWTDPENPGTAELVDIHARSEGVDTVAVDAAGMGVAVTDRVSEIMGGAYALVEVWGSRPSNDRRAYLNIRAEGIFELAAAMMRGEVDIDPADEELLTQLRSVVFEYTEKGQKKIESKDSMKNRGLKSPDKVDATWYAFTDFSRLVEDPLAGASPGDRFEVDFDEWEDEMSLQGPGMPW